MKRDGERVQRRATNVRVYAVLSSSKPRVVYEVHPSREQAEHGAHMSYWGRALTPR